MNLKHLPKDIERLIIGKLDFIVDRYEHKKKFKETVMLIQKIALSCERVFVYDGFLMVRLDYIYNIKLYYDNWIKFSYDVENNNFCGIYIHPCFANEKHITTRRRKDLIRL